jgi:hypothetical protein
LDLVLGSRDEDHTIGLQTFLLTRMQDAFLLSGLGDEHPPQRVAGDTALALTQFDQAALALEDLGGQFAAVLAGHRPLDALDDG